MATIGIKYSLYNFNSSGDALVINWLLSLRKIAKYCITHDTKIGKNKLGFSSP